MKLDVVVECFIHRFMKRVGKAGLKVLQSGILILTKSWQAKCQKYVTA